MNEMPERTGRGLTESNTARHKYGAASYFGAAIALLVMYVFSVGPAAWVIAIIGPTSNVQELFDVVYRPVDAAAYGLGLDHELKAYINFFKQFS